MNTLPDYGLFRISSLEVIVTHNSLFPVGFFISLVPLRPPVRIIDLPIGRRSALIVKIIYPDNYRLATDKKLGELAKYYTTRR